MTFSQLLNSIIVKAPLARILALFGAAFIAAQANAKVRIHQYEAIVNEDLSKVQVKICFDGRAPEYLVVDYKKATKSLVEFPSVDQGYIEFQGRYWKTKKLKANACIQYRSDISSHLRYSKSANDDPKISFQGYNSWLWLPETFSPDETAEITFKLPPGYQVSVPWKLVDVNHNRFQIGHTPLDWGFTLMIGEFELTPIKMSNDGQLNLAVLSGLKQKKLLQKWVLDTTQALIDYLGENPLNHLQVILLENQRFKKGPVPWGDVKRGGGFGIRFVVNSDKAIEEFYADWTATHEFSHLLIPSVEHRDHWLSEGLASYLQYILMGQTGELTEQQTWQRLYQGFKRGDKGTRGLSSETLLETAENRGRGGRSGRTMRVYWSGAVYFMMADWQLRQNSGGEQGLPQVLARLSRCCVSRSQEWSGIELANKLNELSQSNIFSTLYEQIGYSHKFPDYLKTFEQMGINIRNNQVVLSDSKSVDLRQSILQKASPNHSP